MNALRFLLSLPWRALMLVAGTLTVVMGAVSVAFLAFGLGCQFIAETLGGDRS